MESELRIAFYETVRLFADSIGLALSTVGDDFKRETVSSYLLASVLPADPEVIDLCGGARHLWVLQVTIFVRDGNGEFGAIEHADSIRRLFPVLYRFHALNHSFEVQTPPKPAVPDVSDGWLVLPVRFTVQTIH